MNAEEFYEGLSAQDKVAGSVCSRGHISVAYFNILNLLIQNPQTFVISFAHRMQVIHHSQRVTAVYKIFLTS